MKTITLPPGYEIPSGIGITIYNDSDKNVVLKIAKKGAQVTFYERIKVKRRRKHETKK